MLVCHNLGNNVKQGQAESFKVLQSNSPILNISNRRPYKIIDSTMLRLYGTLCVLVFNKSSDVGEDQT